MVTLKNVGGLTQWEDRSGVNKIQAALEEAGALDVAIDKDGKFAPHRELRFGCDGLPPTTVNAAQGSGTNEASEGGDPGMVYTKQSREPYAEVVKRMATGGNDIEPPHHVQRLNERAK